MASVVIERCISRGPLASVYRGVRNGERVALKVYPASRSAPLRLRAERERDLLAELDHRSVARLLDAGELEDGTTYMVTAWVEGQSLETRLRQGPVAFDEIRPILLDIADALQTLHAAGVVHRDLKPANIMLPDDPPPSAVILDCGHSLFVDEVRVTDAGWIVGSADYMAPEQAAGQAIDARVDLYAAGVILYRALTGELPFAATSIDEVLRRHQSEPPVALRARCPQLDIPKAAEDLCLWLLAKQPAVRLPNARVLAITLQSTRWPGRAEGAKAAVA